VTRRGRSPGHPKPSTRIYAAGWFVGPRRLLNKAGSWFGLSCG
jgi:hypothetical protein